MFPGETLVGVIRNSAGIVHETYNKTWTNTNSHEAQPNYLN